MSSVATRIAGQVWITKSNRAGTTPTRKLRSSDLALDRTNQAIQSGDKRTQLTPKGFAVLDYLRSRPGQLVTKDELLNEVWSDVCVVDAVIKNAVREIRRALHDDAKQPKFIETMHRRGYRFIGKLQLTTTPVACRISEASSVIQLKYANERLLVGRDQELLQLKQWWGEVREGKRRTVIINGDTGIGKSTLLKAWLGSISSCGNDPLIVEASCVKTSTNQPYLPFMEAITRLCRGSHGTAVTDLLARHAPSWLAQIPWLAVHADHRAQASRSQFSGQERLFLEAAEFLEVLTREWPLVLAIEDMQWCDQSTRDLLNYIFLREEPARLLLLSTHRDLEARDDVFNRHGLNNEAHRAAWREIVLCPLEQRSVAEYLHQRFPNSNFPPGLVDRLYQQSGGHPLFLKGVLDELIKSGLIQRTSCSWRLATSLENIDANTPASFQQQLDFETQTLTPDEQRLLRAASVVMVKGFSAAAVAALLGQDIVEIEEQCGELSRRGLWIRRLGDRLWPDGTLAQLFSFPYPIYRNYFYQALAAARRRRFHLHLGQRLEVAYGGEVLAIASNLAHHFASGGDSRRALYYRQRSGACEAAELRQRFPDVAPIVTLKQDQITANS